MRTFCVSFMNILLVVLLAVPQTVRAAVDPSTFEADRREFDRLLLEHIIRGTGASGQSTQEIRFENVRPSRWSGQAMAQGALNFGGVTASFAVVLGGLSVMQALAQTSTSPDAPRAAIDQHMSFAHYAALYAFYKTQQGLTPAAERAVNRILPAMHAGAAPLWMNRIIALNIGVTGGMIAALLTREVLSNANLIACARGLSGLERVSSARLADTCDRAYDQLTAADLWASWGPRVLSMIATNTVQTYALYRASQWLNGRYLERASAMDIAVAERSASGAPVVRNWVLRAPESALRGLTICLNNPKCVGGFAFRTSFMAVFVFFDEFITSGLVDNQTSRDWTSWAWSPGQTLRWIGNNLIPSLSDMRIRGVPIGSFFGGAGRNSYESTLAAQIATLAASVSRFASWANDLSLIAMPTLEGARITADGISRIADFANASAQISFNRRNDVNEAVKRSIDQYGSTLREANYLIRANLNHALSTRWSSLDQACALNDRECQLRDLPYAITRFGNRFQAYRQYVLLGPAKTAFDGWNSRTADFVGFYGVSAEAATTLAISGSLRAPLSNARRELEARARAGATSFESAAEAAQFIARLGHAAATIDRILENIADNMDYVRVSAQSAIAGARTGLQVRETQAAEALVAHPERSALIQQVLELQRANAARIIERSERAIQSANAFEATDKARADAVKARLSAISQAAAEPRHALSPAQAFGAAAALGDFADSTITVAREGLFSSGALQAALSPTGVSAGDWPMGMPSSAYFGANMLRYDGLAEYGITHLACGRQNAATSRRSFSMLDNVSPQGALTLMHNPEYRSSFVRQNILYLQFAPPRLVDGSFNICASGGYSRREWEGERLSIEASVQATIERIRNGGTFDRLLPNATRGQVDEFVEASRRARMGLARRNFEGVNYPRSALGPFRDASGRRYMDLIDYVVDNLRPELVGDPVAAGPVTEPDFWKNLTRPMETFWTNNVERQAQAEWSIIKADFAKLVNEMFLPLLGNRDLWHCRNYLANPNEAGTCDDGPNAHPDAFKVYGGVLANMESEAREYFRVLRPLAVHAARRNGPLAPEALIPARPPTPSPERMLAEFNRDVVEPFLAGFRMERVGGQLRFTGLATTDAQGSYAGRWIFAGDKLAIEAAYKVFGIEEREMQFIRNALLEPIPFQAAIDAYWRDHGMRARLTKGQAKAAVAAIFGLERLMAEKLQYVGWMQSADLANRPSVAADFRIDAIMGSVESHVRRVTAERAAQRQQARQPEAAPGAQENAP